MSLLPCFLGYRPFSKTVWDTYVLRSPQPLSTSHEDLGGGGVELEPSMHLAYPNVLVAISFPEDGCLYSEYLSRELIADMALLPTCNMLHFFYDGNLLHGLAPHPLLPC